ncbi:hypothetical protein RJ639_023053 [Escallonia herrerae]|uniref:Cytochrome P450 n=1 Tax=Escallonia herrerae TaxID=1293975 RepID=A0AA88UZD0_9ASTE|nr:hypothetical protein RJ639_023053 [Escallonia herrerae]
MEFLFLLPLLLILAFLVNIFLKTRKPQPTTGNHPSDEKVQLLPPGRTGLPLIGETLDYFSKVFRTSLIGQPVAILCGPEGNKFLFSNESKLVQLWYPTHLDKIFPKVDNTDSGVTSSTNEQSKVIRKQLPAVLKLENLINHIGMMDTVMKQQLHTEWNREKITVVPTVTKFTLTLSCRFFLGIEDPKMVEEIDVWIKEIDPGIMSIPINFPGTYFNRAIKASKVMRDKIKLFVRQAKNDLQEGSASESKSFMMHMLRTADENGQFFSESYLSI